MILPQRLRLAMLACTALPLRAEVTAISPVFGQIVAVSVPDGFGMGVASSRGDSYIREFVPQDETAQGNWSQMLAVNGARGLAGLPLAQAAQHFAQGFGDVCPGTLNAIDLGAQDIPGAAAAQAHYIGCGHVMAPPERLEAMVVVILQGSEDLYTLQWAMRAPAQDSAPQFDPGLWGPRLDSLLGIARLCAIVAGEAPPYPSCAAD